MYDLPTKSPVSSVLCLHLETGGSGGSGRFNVIKVVSWRRFEFTFASCLKLHSKLRRDIEGNKCGGSPPLEGEFMSGAIYRAYTCACISCIVLDLITSSTTISTLISSKCSCLFC